jgi:hypothetical protein
LAATRRIVVDTTLLAPLTALVQERVVREPDVPAIRRAQVANLESLYESGVRLAIGSDSVIDSSVRELF